MVVTLAVVQGKERFAGVFLARKSGFQIIAVTETVAQRVVKLRAQVTGPVPPAGIERHIQTGKHFVPAIFRKGTQGGKGLVCIVHRSHANKRQ